MITRVRLRNFKCFQDAVLPFGALTLLAGINGSGKSSVIQALLLLRQSWSAVDVHNFGFLGLRMKRLALNGPMVQLGNAKDALYAYADVTVHGPNRQGALSAVPLQSPDPPGPLFPVLILPLRSR